MIPLRDIANTLQVRDAPTSCHLGCMRRTGLVLTRRAGFGYEFMERPDGYEGLAATYGPRSGSPPRTMEIGLLNRALMEKQVDIVAGSATDGAVAALDLLVLEDGRRYFPPITPPRRTTPERHPALRAVLQELAGKISEEEMRRLNYAVEGEGRGLNRAVRDFLQAKGL
jgi:osmoprotectant transport system substrate-binding protein